LAERELSPQVARWAAFNGCDDVLVEDDHVDLADPPGAETARARHACPEGASAELWTIAGGPHSATLCALGPRRPGGKGFF
jgi:hypothetical protein